MHDPHPTRPLDAAASTLLPPQPTAVYVGGGLGIAGTFLGLAIFLAACFGLEAAFKLSLLPLLLGAAGLLLTLAGAAFSRAKAEDTHVVAALFVNLFALVGALLEVSAWLRWPVFYPAA